MRGFVKWIRLTVILAFLSWEQIAYGATLNAIYGFGCCDPVEASPITAIVENTTGDLFFTTAIFGGAGPPYGGVFRLTQAGNLTVLYDFCPVVNSCGPGAGGAGLVIGPAGKIYGATTSGGTSGCRPIGCGTIFELTPSTDGVTWTYKLLYTFCSVSLCADGSHPVGFLTIGNGGNLYGATQATVFLLVQSKSGWLEQTLYSLCPPSVPCVDENISNIRVTGLTRTSSGILYGSYVNNDAGTLFELKPDVTETNWHFRVIHKFCSQPRCADGGQPMGAMVSNASGELFGITRTGGANGKGVVFELAQNRASNWKFTVLHNFCSLALCADGSQPTGGLVIDQSANLYGITSQGGGVGFGTIFRIRAPDSHIQKEERVVYSFCSYNSCNDGGTPSNLIIGPYGGIFGTTTQGGPNGDGTAFGVLVNKE